ncbi:hypothetical protein BT96DRAFT_967581 [Gymnopus androsaceus JB14]|uniref:Uncharacterized protein n=1 Tax=Gymnopus androsaceus JB14 TaxID=1447944 RepID=A0A6A4H379_9AGAR|nr:hypothetical protein BT96DRAFT_967581 [Gymnopus androsaceus JB14]
MTTAPTANSRASLLSGLRTGGVRSSSASIPHTAAPGGAFNVPRLVLHNSGNFPNEEQDYISEMPSNLYANNHHGGNRTIPLTAAVDGPNNRFSQQQRSMNPNVTPFSPAYQQPNNAQAQQQALQMQMMQLEIMRIQAVQAQQIQAEMLAQAQRQQQAQNRRSSLGFNPPATAGPLSTGFDIRAATLNAQMRRANQAEQQAQLGADDQVPMTAALGGKSGDASLPPTPSSTTVISGGTSLGNPSSNNITSGSTHSKSDSATSWRRGGKGNSVLGQPVRVTPPAPERVSPPPGVTSAASAAAKSRPMPLRFSVVAQQPLPSVTIDTSESNDNDDSSSTSSYKSTGSHSSPTTPHSSSSNEMPLSPREEASKKLYEGLGIGRPASAIQVSAEDAAPAEPIQHMVSHRLVSQPLRQPRGPPSGADELGPKNFATRIRRKAIGGLGMLMGARERREIVEVY